MLTQVNCLVTNSCLDDNMINDINLTDKDGNNLMHYIMGRFDDNPEENKDKVVELINAGIDTNQYNLDSFTPLQIACKNRQIEAVKFCIEVNLSATNQKGGDIFDFKLRSKNNYSLLHIACAFTFDKFFDLYMESDYLVTKLNIMERDKFYRKPSELVLYNSSYFKKLKRIERKYTEWRLSHKKKQK